jgi:hypothetical protein
MCRQTDVKQSAVRCGGQACWSRTFVTPSLAQWAMAARSEDKARQGRAGQDSDGDRREIEMMFCCRLAGWAGWRIGGEPCAGSGMQPRQGSGGRNPTRARASRSATATVFSPRRQRKCLCSHCRKRGSRQRAQEPRRKGATALEVASPRDTMIVNLGTYLPPARQPHVLRERASERGRYLGPGLPGSIYCC